MKLSQLIEFLTSVKDRRDLSVKIAIEKPFATVGARPSVSVKSVSVGFDWDNGNLFIIPDQPLMNSEDCTEASSSLRKLYDKVGWLEYEKQGLQSQIKRMKKIIKEFENANQTD